MTTVHNDSKPDSFRDLQHTFTRHMRDPENTPIPANIERRRIDIYTDLIYRNIESAIANSFPVLRKITTDKNWHAMLRDYVKNHIARTPCFPKMPLEFLDYLEHERDAANDPPFYFELAHYEWVELSLTLDRRDISFDTVDPEGDLLDGRPVLSPLVLPLVYQWPVHRIGPDYMPVKKPDQPSYLMVYRDRNYEIGFMELNPVSARLIEILTHDNAHNGRSILEAISKQIQHPDPDVVITGGLETMRDFRSKDIILGTVNSIE